MSASIILPGQQFGKLTTIELGHPTKHGERRWLCRCDCAALRLHKEFAVLNFPGESIPETIEIAVSTKLDALLSRTANRREV